MVHDVKIENFVWKFRFWRNSKITTDVQAAGIDFLSLVFGLVGVLAEGGGERLIFCKILWKRNEFVQISIKKLLFDTFSQKKRRGKYAELFGAATGEELAEGGRLLGGSFFLKKLKNIKEFHTFSIEKASKTMKNASKSRRKCFWEFWKFYQQPWRRRACGRAWTGSSWVRHPILQKCKFRKKNHGEKRFEMCLRPFLAQKIWKNVHHHPHHRSRLFWTSCPWRPWPCGPFFGGDYFAYFE